MSRARISLSGTSSRTSSSSKEKLNAPDCNAAGAVMLSPPAATPSAAPVGRAHDHRRFRSWQLPSRPFAEETDELVGRPLNDDGA
jgi:hypothetical protein